MTKFSIVLIPDTQVAIQSWPEVSYAAADWVAQNRQRLNIAAVIHVGDMIEWPRDADWGRFGVMYAKLGDIPTSLAVGNHDFDHWNDQTGQIFDGKGDRSLDRFRRFFPIDKFKNVVDSFPSGKAGNVAQTFSAAGIDFLMVSILYWPTTEELNWLDRVLTAHPDEKVIINTHDFMNNDDRSEAGNKIWAVAKRHSNVVMICNGHWYPTAGHRVDEGDNGNTIYQVMADYQNYNSRDPNSYIQILTFDTSDLTLNVETFSPFLGQHMTGRGNEFELAGVQFLADASEEPNPEPEPEPVPVPVPIPGGKMRRYPGVQTGPVGERIIAFVEKYYPKVDQLYVTSAFRNEQGSHHGGLDWAGSPTAAVDFGAYDGVGIPEGQLRMRDFAKWLDDNFRSDLAELIHTTPYDTDAGFYVTLGRRGSFGAGTMADHLNHVHVAFSEESLSRAISRLDGVQTPNPEPTPTPGAGDFGLDYAFSRPSIAAMKAAGVKFVCRYLSQVNGLTRPKLLTRAEAESLSQAGISVVSNFEWYPERCTEGFAAGAEDATIALEQARECGMPEGRPIYFSVDIDTIVGMVRDYFDGIRSVLPITQIGVYGSYDICQDLHSEARVGWLWQTYAWSSGRWYANNHIEQYSNGETLGGADVDFNRSKKADVGAWFVGVPGPIPGPNPEPTPQPIPQPTPGDDELQLSDLVPSAATPDVPDRSLDQVLGDLWRGVHWGIPELQSQVDEIVSEVEELKSTPPAATEIKVSGFSLSKYAKAIMAALTTGVGMYTAFKSGGVTPDEWQQILVATLAALGITWGVPNKTDV